MCRTSTKNHLPIRHLCQNKSYSTEQSQGGAEGEDRAVALYKSNRMGQIAYHRAHAKQRGSDVTAEQGGRLEERAVAGGGEERHGEGTDRTERRDI